MDEIDRQAVPAGEADRARRRRPRAPTVWPKSAPPRTPGNRATPRPRKTTPAHGRSGRQSRVFGSASPKPSHRSQGGSNRVERPSHGAAIAAKPIARLAQAGALDERRGEEARDRDAMKNAKGDGLARREDEAARGHQRRGAGDDRKAPPEGAQVQPLAMGKRERYADQDEERARHDMREEPHLRRERQRTAGQAENRRGPSSGGRRPCRRAPDRARNRQRRRDPSACSRCRRRQRRRSRRRGFEQGVVENERAFVLDRAGHQHVVVRAAPLNDEVAARETHCPLAIHEFEARPQRRGSRRRPSRRRGSNQRRAPRPLPSPRRGRGSRRR